MSYFLNGYSYHIIGAVTVISGCLIAYLYSLKTAK